MKKGVYFLLRQTPENTKVFLKLYGVEILIKYFTSHQYARRWTRLFIRKICETNGQIPYVVEKDMFYVENRRGEKSV